MTRGKVEERRLQRTMTSSNKDIQDSLLSDELMQESAISDSEGDFDKNNNCPPSPEEYRMMQRPECSRKIGAEKHQFANRSHESLIQYGSSFDDSCPDEVRDHSSQLENSDDHCKIEHDGKEPGEEDSVLSSDEESNANNNSNHKRLRKRLSRRKPSDVENNNNNNLWKNNRMRSVQLSSVRAGTGMNSTGNLNPYIERMISKDGSTNIRVKKSGILDLFTRYSKDIYTTVVDLNLTWVLLLTAIVYIGQWLIFGGVYYIFAISNGDVTANSVAENSTTDLPPHTPCVSNVYDFVTAFLFSMESETTIGYGSRSMGVVCPGAMTMLVIQCVLSAIFDTWVIGLCYAKFASPYHRKSTVMFAKNAVICRRDGKRCLIVRVANLRKSLLLTVSCRARILTLRAPRPGAHNVGNLQQDELSFQNENGIMLTAPMEYRHVIDDKSPLHSIPVEYFESEEKNWFEVVVILSGVIEATGMVLHAQTSYLSSEVKYKHRYSTILSESAQSNRYIVDFKRFHDTEKEPDVSCETETFPNASKKYAPLHGTVEEEDDDEVFELSTE